MSFDILYTGANSAARIPELNVLQNAEDKFYETIARKDEIATERAMQNEKDFLVQAKSDPVLLISDKNRMIQADALENYKNKWAKVYMQRNGNLSMQDKLDMQRDKDALIMTQQQLLGDQQKYLNDKEIIAKDTANFYDHKLFQKAEQDFYRTGKYNSIALIPNPQDIVSAFKNKYKDYGQIPTQRTWTDEAGNMWSSQDVQNMTVDDAKEKLPTFILNNEGFVRKMIEDANDPKNEAELKPYLMDFDRNGNGIIDPAEKQEALSQPPNLDNPILRWAADHYSKEAVLNKVGTPKKLTSNKTVNYKVNLGGQDVTIKHPVIMQTGAVSRRGSTDYKAIATWQYGKTVNVPLNGARILDSNGDESIPDDAKSHDAQFTGVGIRSDGKVELLFQTPSADWMGLGRDKGTDLALPAENNPDYWTWPVEYNGKIVTVGQLMKQGQSQAETTKPKSSVTNVSSIFGTK